MTAAHNPPGPNFRTGPLEWGRPGGVSPRKKGNPGRSCLDAHEAFILGLIDERADITLAEMAQRLEADHGLRVQQSTLWYFLDKRGQTFKKRRATRPNRIGRTSTSVA